MSRLMDDNANVVNPEHAIDHNSFGGVAYVPVSSPLTQRLLVEVFRRFLLQNKYFNIKTYEKRAMKRKMSPGEWTNYLRDMIIRTSY